MKTLSSFLLSLGATLLVTQRQATDSLITHAIYHTTALFNKGKGKPTPNHTSEVLCQGAMQILPTNSSPPKSITSLALFALLVGFSAGFAIPVAAQETAPLASVQTIDVGGYPVGLAFDGDNIWAALGLANSVAKVRASDGVVLDTFPAGGNPVFLVFDGANIWRRMKIAIRSRKSERATARCSGPFASAAALKPSPSMAPTSG